MTSALERYFSYMQPYIIELDTNVNYFKEIFFKNRQGSIIHNNITKKPVKNTILILVITIAFYFLGFLYPKGSWLFIFGVVITIFAVAISSISVTKFYAWKKSVNHYLHTVEQIGKAILVLQPEVFELRIDDKTIIERLSFLKKVEIGKFSIILKSETDNYFFPAKSMKNEDFIFLTSYLKEKMAK